MSDAKGPTPREVEAAVEAYMKGQGVNGGVVMRYVEEMFRRRMGEFVRKLEAKVEREVEVYVARRVGELTKEAVAAMVRERIAERITVNVAWNEPVGPIDTGGIA